MSPSSSDSTLDFVSGAIRTVGRHWTSHWATETPYRPQKSCYWLIIIPLPGDTCRITPPVQGFQNVMSALYQGRHRMSALTHAQCHLRGHRLSLWSCTDACWGLWPAIQHGCALYFRVKVDGKNANKSDFLAMIREMLRFYKVHRYDFQSIGT